MNYPSTVQPSTVHTRTGAPTWHLSFPGNHTLSFVGLPTSVTVLCSGCSCCPLWLWRWCAGNRHHFHHHPSLAAGVIGEPGRRQPCAAEHARDAVLGPALQSAHFHLESTQTFSIGSRQMAGVLRAHSMLLSVASPCCSRSGPVAPVLGRLRRPLVSICPPVTSRLGLRQSPVCCSSSASGGLNLGSADQQTSPATAAENSNGLQASSSAPSPHPASASTSASSTSSTPSSDG